MTGRQVLRADADRATGRVLPEFCFHVRSFAYWHIDGYRARIVVLNDASMSLAQRDLPDDEPAGSPADVMPPAPLLDPVVRGLTAPEQPSWFDKVEAFISRLSVRDNFWNSICSLIWLPLAAFSGIRMKELDAGSFVAQAILPFRRFNRNWYRAMAGGALLANSEIAGGGYVFGICGAEYTVVCKNLNYTFLRPCLGPAVYRMTPRQNIRELMKVSSEFNITIDMEISQQGFKGAGDRRVGRCEAVFHVTPKIHHKRKAKRAKKN